MTMLLYLFLLYSSIIGRGVGLAPILDKTEIVAGENFTVTCDVRRVTDDPISSICYLFISFRNRFKPINEFLAYVWLCEDNIKYLGEDRGRWKTTYIDGNRTAPGESQVILVNTNSTYDDAGVYTCTYAYRHDVGRRAASQTLKVKVPPSHDSPGLSQLHATDDKVGRATWVEVEVRSHQLTTKTRTKQQITRYLTVTVSNKKGPVDEKGRGSDLNSKKNILRVIILVLIPGVGGIAALLYILMKISGVFEHGQILIGLQRYQHIVPQRYQQLAPQMAIQGAPQMAIQRAQRRRNPPAARGRRGNLVANRMCSVCFEESPHVTLHPCLHTNICEGCTIKIIEKKNRPCPFCRVRIEGYF